MHWLCVFTHVSCPMQGVANTAEAAKEAGVDQVVLVSSMLVHPSNR